MIVSVSRVISVIFKTGLLVLITFLWSCNRPLQQVTFSANEDPLPSWNEGPSKDRIIAFVENATDSLNENFIPENERIAVFDNDGTLWSEQPLYAQLQFALDRVKQLLPQHPEWREKALFRAAINNDIESIMDSGNQGILDLVMATHTGMTTGEFSDIVRNWIDTARHPLTDLLYKEMVYQPMLELLQYLRLKKFTNYIVSAGGIEFMRPWAESVYGIPARQVIGSTIDLRYEMRDSIPVLVRLPRVTFIDDREGKPTGIERFIGRRPIVAFGNSDGDFQMLQWTAAGDRPGLVAFIHHTDSAREWAYDRKSHIGRLDEGLDEALAKGWLVVDMKNDWKRIFPSQ